jgi:hypothetical protein
MGQIVIDDKYGFDTVFSTDPTSPAAPYIREYQPSSLQDLYDIGVIPKHVPINVLEAAREAGLKASAGHMRITSPTFRGLPVQAQRQYIQSRSNAIGRENAVRVTTQILVAQHNYSAEEAALLALKAHSVAESVSSVAARSLVFIALLLPDDLIVKTPLVIDSTIQSVTAKDVHIFRTGSIRPLSSYFLLTCQSIRGEGFWWQDLLSKTVSKEQSRPDTLN